MSVNINHMIAQLLSLQMGLHAQCKRALKVQIRFIAETIPWWTLVLIHQSRLNVSDVLNRVAKISEL